MRASVLALLICLWPAVSPAQNLEQAKAYFDAGKQAYEAREYLAAAAAFQQAYELSGKSAVLFSTAQAYRLHFLLQRDVTSLDSAVDLYRRYLIEAKTGSRRADAAEHLASLELQLAQLAPDDPNRQRPNAPRLTQVMVASRTEGARVSMDGSKAAPVPLVRTATPGVHRVLVSKEGFFEESLEIVAVEGRLVVAQVNLQPRPAKLTLAAPTGSQVLVDGRPLGHAPLGSVELDAGRRLITISARGKHGFAKEVNLTRGQDTLVKVELKDTGQRTLSYWVLAGGGAVFTAAITTGILAGLNDASARIYLARQDLGEVPLTTEELATYRSARAKASDFKRAFWGTLIASSVITGVGAALYYFDSPSSSAPGMLSVAPAISPDGAFVQSNLRF